MTKRALDILLSASALALLSLPMAALMLWLLVAQGRPIFFGQTRMGRGGRPFRLLKFRTMVVQSGFDGNIGADADAAQIAALRKSFTGTVAGDRRITPTGRWLRRTHIDELPQLINVLVGDMSMVGPRPDTPVQRLDYQPDHLDLRLSVRPGLTGLAQVHDGPRMNRLLRLGLDIRYIRNRSLCLDARIIVRTAAKVFAASAD